MLLLNATYEPLHVITARRALGLLLAGKAEMIEEGDGEFRSPSRTVTIPAVVRLHYMVRVPFRARVPLTRRTLTIRDNGRCQVARCPQRGSTIDHVVPKSRGGKHIWSNVVLMCAKHNEQKSDRLLRELGWELKAEPRAPRQHHLVLVAANASMKPAWQAYLGAVYPPPRLQAN